MKNIAENNLVRFINITKKKDGIFANFKVKGIKGGTTFSASIAVDVSAVEVDLATDPIEKIIDHCAHVAVKEFKKSEFRFEGISSAI
jgi:hypothetical protein